MVLLAGCGPGFECLEEVSGDYESVWTERAGGTCGPVPNQVSYGLYLDLVECQASSGNDRWWYTWTQSSPDGNELQAVVLRDEGLCQSTYDVVYTRI